MAFDGWLAVLAASRIPTRVNAPPFSAWVASRDRDRSGHVPDADRLVPLVRTAGPHGLSRSGIGRAVSLDPDTLDDLLGALVGAGQLRVREVDGFRVYSAT